jgi:hypothetical protein
MTTTPSLKVKFFFYTTYTQSNKHEPRNIFTKQTTKSCADAKSLILVHEVRKTKTPLRTRII